MARYLIILLLIARTLYAAPAGGGGGVGNPAGLRIQQGGVIKGDTGVLDLPAADYTCTPFPVMTCALNTSVSHGGSCIGDAPLDTCSPFDLTNKQIIISSSLNPTLPIVQQTAGTPVMSLSSIPPTGSNIFDTVYQNRVTTTDATQTTLHSISTISSILFAVEARVTARRTGGSAGTAEDGAYYILNALYKNVGGAATIIGSVSQTVVGESQAGFDATLTTSGGSVLVRVTGVVNNNITWNATIHVWQVNT